MTFVGEENQNRFRK